MSVALGAVRTGPWGLLLVYVRVLLSLFKPRWSPAITDSKLPELEVSFDRPSKISAPELERFKTLAGWPPEAEKGVKAESPEPSTSSFPQPEITPEPQPEYLPLVFLVSQTFRLAMAIMFSSHFPYRVLGCVVNRRAQYTLFRGVTVDDTLEHSCKLNPITRSTPGGHLEFDLTISSRLASTDELVWTAKLTLVLLKPSGRRPKAKDEAPVASPAHEQAATEQDKVPLAKTLRLHPDAGRRYAVLDGDVSPMHLWPWSAWLVGFPRPVANVHLVMGKLEVVLAEVVAASGGLLPVPATMEAEFKSPALLPAKIEIRTPPVEKGVAGTQELARLAHSAGGLTFSLFSVKPAPPPGPAKHPPPALGEKEEERGKEILAGRLLLRTPHEAVSQS